MVLQLGDRVEVVGLVSDSGRGLNGQIGNITVQLADRWGVKLASGVEKAIKAGNLKLLSTCPICLEPLVSHIHALHTFRCGHQLHEKCMGAFRRHGQPMLCPVCRSADNLVSEQLYEQACAQQDMNNYGEVMRLLLEIMDIDPGHAEANGFLGTIYLSGRGGTPQNYEKAFAHFAVAHRHGCTDASCQLGTMYEHGHGTMQDFGKALELYEEVHRKGFASGTCSLGVLHAAGRGTPQDFGKALELFEAAHAQKCSQATFHLGVMHLKGDGVPKDEEKALDFLEAAKRQGHADAAAVLSLLHDQGS